MTFKQILKTRRGYRLQKFFDIDQSKDYIEKVNNTIPVNELYEVIDSCNYNEKNYWCPVLLKIGNELLKEKFVGEEKDFKIKGDEDKTKASTILDEDKGLGRFLRTFKGPKADKDKAKEAKADKNSARGSRVNEDKAKKSRADENRDTASRLDEDRVTEVRVDEEKATGLNRKLSKKLL